MAIPIRALIVAAHNMHRLCRKLYAKLFLTIDYHLEFNTIAGYKKVGFQKIHALQRLIRMTKGIV